MSDQDIPLGARNVVTVCANVRRGEQVLVVTDTHKAAVADPIARGAMAAGAEVCAIVMDPRSAHGEEPPATVAAAMRRADVLFLPTTFSLSHARARIEACNQGARALSMADLSVRQLSEGGLLADFEAEAPRVHRVAGMLTQHDTLRLTSTLGTDLTMKISGRNGNAATCLCRNPGDFGSPPDIEANIAPLEDSAEGVVAVDGSIPHPRLGLLGEPVRLVVRAGQIVGIDGGPKSAALRDLLDNAGDPAVRVLAEFGVGLNSRATLCGSMLEDEGACGTIHLGFGANLALGGSNEAPLHIDCIVRNPTVWLDGSVALMESGSVCV